MNNKVILAVGVVIGFMLAAFGALAPTLEDLPNDVVARVNGKAITAEELAFALERSGKAEAVTREQRLAVLRQLIDQELLVQRGVEIGLLEADHTVRKTIAMAMIDAVVAEVLAKEPAEKELQVFYQSHLAVFTLPPRAQAQQIFCSRDRDQASAYTRAERAREALVQGVSFQDVRAWYGDDDHAVLPEGLTSLPVLRRLLGPTLSDALLALKVGEISAVLSTGAGYFILQLADWQAEQVQPYEAVRQEVRTEYLRRKRDEALQHYLDRLRREATIVLSPKAPRLDMFTKVEPAGES
jgi:parvulin-like peptidyl-prolyl isomerase